MLVAQLVTQLVALELSFLGLTKGMDARITPLKLQA